MSQYAVFFAKATGFEPYDWQRHVAEDGFPELLPVPTGLGKTEGVVLAWAWRLQKNKGEPRHLVYCLPMRVLVRQTVERLRKCFERLGHPIPIYQLTGGSVDEEWAYKVEVPWVLVGTQDQLLSRALNRGYAMSRFEWPVHFGLLNNDCRWIVDEIQLMGPGLWTTAQLDWMRRKRFGTVFDCPTTWMSATLSQSFLQTTDRNSDGLKNPDGWLQEIQHIRKIIDNDSNPEIKRRLAAHRTIEWSPQAGGKTFTAGRGRGKNRSQSSDDFFSALAKSVVEQHCEGTLSLVICNTVEAARRLYGALPEDKPKLLLTSRFRGKDRSEHEGKLIEFELKRRENGGKPVPDHPGLICISTQVVEAGMDISAHRLWSELAPWPSIIQRLGRLNRDGTDNDATAWFWETPEGGPTGPYDEGELQFARQLVERLIPLSKGKPFSEAMSELEQKLPQEFQKSLSIRPEPMPRAFDVHGLFSTERDVHGGFTDISLFVRGVDEDADVIVVWRDWDGGPKKEPPPAESLDGPPIDIPNEGCPVPFHRLQEMAKNSGCRAWIWNEEEANWEEVRPDDFRPGMVLLLNREAGGYSEKLGWTGDPTHSIAQVPRVGLGQAFDDDERSLTSSWVTLKEHLLAAEKEAEELCKRLGISSDLRNAVVAAARWHDLGKAHPQWQKALPIPRPNHQGPWAKCPYVFAVEARSPNELEQISKKVEDQRGAAPDEIIERGGEKLIRRRWFVETKPSREILEVIRHMPGVRWVGLMPFRPGLRHEAVTAMAMWSRYRAKQGNYPALAVYLAAAHHGKVRTVFRSLTAGGEDAFGVPPEPKEIEFDGERWELDFTVVKDGAEGRWIPNGFELFGHGWTGLVADLLGPWQDRSQDKTEAGVVPQKEPRSLGPFRLAYLEALVRIADWRASQLRSSLTASKEVDCDS